MVLFQVSPEDELFDHQTLKQSQDDLLEVLRGAKIVWEDRPPKPVPPSKEYVEMMERARLIVEEREYAEMTKNIDQGNNDSPWNPKEWKNVTKQMTGIFNIFLSIAAVFTAVFYLGEHAHWDLGLVRICFDSC